MEGHTNNLTKLAGCVHVGNNVDADQARRGEGQAALGHTGAPYTVANIKKESLLCDRGAMFVNAANICN